MTIGAFLLSECAEAYVKMDENQSQRLKELLNTEQYQQVRPIMITTFERGEIGGVSSRALRENVLFLLEKKFGAAFS